MFVKLFRLTPVYMLVLFVYVTTFPYWGDGPFYPQKTLEPDQCKETWWTNLLYINNFVPTDKICFGWSWYLANDMQFYVISPLLFIPLSDQNAYMATYYFKPWCRMGPYIVGILAGYLLYKTKCKLRINKYVNIALWLLTTATGLAILYGLYDALRGNSPLTLEVSAFYNATHRSAWGFCVCWVIVSCATGHGGYINTLLSWRAFIPLSRLTYCAYLVHPIIIFLVSSYLVAFVVSLAFESPMMGLEKLIVSFSVYTNGKKLLNTKQSTGTITAINGIRFISMTWVILGHSFSSVLYNGRKLSYA
ncbi:hypothetical protein KUTeg_017968 [Tegillarca granosa]|uniref:Acyltransferase 3 domain-containing protein n=1 Tax=Tegillarca granosa TaxID=220873 RepID=A0ABQ9EGQ6_TEGGR|nr:hypothetical protein KUTeg_017968 [Tegillarca granosa]